MAFGIDEGPSSQENQQYGSLTSAGAFATNNGENDINASSTFMQGLLSGDSTKIASVLAPQIGTAKTSAQQQNKTTAMFGNRSGGTAASTAATNDKVHSDITSLIGNLTGTAATTLGTMGTSLFGTGVATNATAFDEATKMQGQRASQWSDLVSSIASTAGGIAGLPGVSKAWSQGLNSFAGAFEG